MQYKHHKRFHATLSDLPEKELNTVSTTLGKELQLQSGMVRSIIRKYHQVAEEQGEFNTNTSDQIIASVAKSTRINADDVARTLDELTRMGNSGAIPRSVSHPLTGSGWLGEVSGTLTSATKSVNTAKNTYSAVRNQTDSATKAAEQLGKTTGADALVKRPSKSAEAQSTVPTRKVNEQQPTQQQPEPSSTQYMIVGGGAVVGGGAGFALAYKMKWSIARKIGATLVGGVVGGTVAHFVAN
jgi:hypothetical protein